MDTVPLIPLLLSLTSKACIHENIYSNHFISASMLFHGISHLSVYTVPAPMMP
jgi:hypothetical protein